MPATMSLSGTALPPEVYPPLEDSELLAEQVRHCAKGRVLDMGCGSGIQSKTVLSCTYVRSVLGVDINPIAVRHCTQTIKGAKFIVSDLFSKVPNTHFNTIIFNPPYLPDDGFPADPATIGGKKGWETIERFLSRAADFMTADGQILLLFTSRTDKDKVHELINRYMLDWSVLTTEHIAYETYYVYRITKTVARQDVERHDVRTITILAKGKRGVVYRGKMGRNQVVLKVVNPASKAAGTLATEARMLVLLNSKRIGPKLFFSTENVVCMQFVPGPAIREWLECTPHPSKQNVTHVLLDVLKQCYAMDKIGVQKEEMQHPYKHIIVSRYGASLRSTLIDFERCHRKIRAHNVTQFCQYIASIADRNESPTMPRRFHDAAAAYSKKHDAVTFRAIIALLNDVRPALFHTHAVR